MPCWTERRISVEFKQENYEVLEDAIKSLGYNPYRVGNQMHFETNNGTVVINKGKMTLSDRDTTIVERLNRAYTETALVAKAKKFNWVLKKTGENTFVAQRR